MNKNLKHLVSMALCCAPMLAAPLLLGVAGALGWRTGAFGVGLTVLAVLACPVSIGLMMWQMSRHSHVEAASTTPMAYGEPPERATEKLAQSTSGIAQLEAAQPK